MKTQHKNLTGGGDGPRFLFVPGPDSSGPGRSSSQRGIHGEIRYENIGSAHCRKKQ